MSYGGSSFFDDGGSSRGADWAALKRGEKTMWQKRGGATWWGSRTNESFHVPDHLKPSGSLIGYQGAQGTRKPSPRVAARYPGKAFVPACSGELGMFEASAEVERIANTAGADVDGLVDADGTTPVGLAAKNKQAHVVRTLVRLGADVNHADEDGRTPCWWATHANCVEVLEVLCQARADLDRGDRDGETPLSHAIGCRWVSPQSETEQASTGAVFKMAMGTSKRAAALFLLGAGADADLCSNDGQNPLFAAVHWENDEAFARLIARGVDVTARDQMGRTAQDVATKQGIGKPWARVYPKVLREETDKQRAISALCSVYQRLALAKIVHGRLAAQAPGYRWLPYDLLESIGRFLVPPPEENLSNGKRASSTRKGEASRTVSTPALVEAAANLQVDDGSAQDLPEVERQVTRAQWDELSQQPTVVEQEYVTLATVSVRNLPGGIGSKQIGTLRKGTRVFVKWSIMINGRTWVCCCAHSAFRYGHNLVASLTGDTREVEFWTQLRSADGQRMLKRSDGSEDLALRGFWEGLPAAAVALRMLRQEGRAEAHGYTVDVVPPSRVDHKSSPRGRRLGSARRAGGGPLREQLHAKTGITRNSKATKQLEPLS